VFPGPLAVAGGIVGNNGKKREGGQKRKDGRQRRKERERRTGNCAPTVSIQKSAPMTKARVRSCATNNTSLSTATNSAAQCKTCCK